MKAIRNFQGRKYYKQIVKNWTRPNITSNGELGGSRFAVSPNRENASYMPANFGGKAWQAFDGNSTTGWGTWSQSASVHYIIIYIPIPICITRMQLSFASSTADTGGHSHNYVSASNDGDNWTQIYSHDGTISDLVISNSKYYQYYKLDIRTPGGDDHDAIGIYECKITATYKEIVEGTAGDYTYYQTFEECSVFKKGNRLYAQKETS